MKIEVQTRGPQTYRLHSRGALKRLVRGKADDDRDPINAEVRLHPNLDWEPVRLLYLNGANIAVINELEPGPHPEPEPGTAPSKEAF